MDHLDRVVERNLRKAVRWLVAGVLLLAVLMTVALCYGGAVYRRVGAREAACMAEGWR